MTLDLLRQEKSSKENEFFFVCSDRAYKNYWLPAAQELQLKFIEMLRCLDVFEHERCEFVSELHKLEKWAIEKSGVDIQYSAMAKTCAKLIEIISNTDFKKYNVSIG